MMEFEESAIFQYNGRNKIVYGISLIAGALFLAIIVALFHFYLRHLEMPGFLFFKSLYAAVIAEIGSGSLLGALYSSAIGGLFFLAVPMEVLFFRFLRGDADPFMLIGFYLVGFLISYSINYFLGMKLSGISRRLVTPKKFYRIKGVINRYGVAAVFIFNATPLPSQPLSALLGVFKYNRTKFYVFFLLGQFVKYAALTVGYVAIT